MKPVENGLRSRTRFTERKVFRSSVHVHLGGSRSRSIDENTGPVEFHVDPNTKKLVNSALSGHDKEKTPEFVSKPKRQFVNEGEIAKFKAQIEESPSTVLSWNLNGTTLANDDKHKIYMEKDVHILEVAKVTEKDQGSYVCKIHNSAGSATADAELEVFVRPKPQKDKSAMFVSPSVDIPLEDTEFADKEKDATLVCKFHNAIDGTAKWYKDGRELGSWQAKTTFDGRTARLVLREAVKRVCGVYECIVKNSGGEAKTQALVSLLDPSVKPSPPKFTLALNDQAVESGEKLVLETEVTGKPRPSLKWYKDNEELGSSQDIRMEFKDGKGRLIMDNLDLSEGSKFTCIAKNIAGEDETMASVSGSAEVREPPIFTKELQDMEVSDGDRVEMSVEVNGTPPIDIVWVHNNREIPPTDPVCRMLTNGNTHMLIIPETFPEDSGEYVCEAYNDYGDTDTFCRLTVHEEKDVVQNISQKAPEFIVAPQNLHVDEGASISLSCQVGGIPLPSVQWSCGRQVLKHGVKYKISSIGEEHFLDIAPGTAEETGPYTCTLCNQFGTTNATCQLTVGDIAASNPSLYNHRSHLKNRSHRDHSVKHNGTESESSDISSLDGEVFQSQFVVNINREPSNGNQSTLKNSAQFYDTHAAVKRHSEPFHDTQPVNEVVAARKVSAPLSRVPLEVSHTNASKQDTIAQKLPVNRTFYNTSRQLPVTRDLHNTSISGPSLNNGQSNGAQSRRLKTTGAIPRKGEPVTGAILGNRAKVREPVIEKKGGVTQVDFRGVLKHKHSSKDSGVLDINGHSPKLVNDIKLPRREIKDFSKVFEPESNKRVSDSVHNNGKPQENQNKGLKVNEALKRFEDNSSSAQSDFRSNLKTRKEHTHSEVSDKQRKPERPNNRANSQLDNRNFLRKNNEVATVSVTKDDRKFKPESRTDQLSDSSFEKKSIQKQRAELVVNVRSKSIDKVVTTPKQKKEFDLTNRTQLEIPVKKYFERSIKIDPELDLPVGKLKIGQFEDQLVEFRSVIKRPECDTKQESKDYTADIIKPIPRRLSHSKQLTMDLKPEIKEDLENQSVEYGSEVILQCCVSGKPEPELCWSINDKEIKQSKYFRMCYSAERAKLVIAEVFSEDEGEYTCTATNTAGSAWTKCHIQVQDRPGTPENDTIQEPFSPTATPPKIYNISPSEFCILRGGKIEFTASFTSVPPGTITWSRGKQELQSAGRMQIETSDCFSTLTIVDIHPEDCGRLQIRVGNKLGADVAFASLTVEDVPDAPVGQPWVSEVSLISATVAWYGPAYDGGCPITNYRVEMCDAEEQEWSLVNSKCQSTTCRIEELQPHTPYFFRVFAENKHGLSEPCMTPEVTVTSDRRPSTLLRLPSTESDDVFTHEIHEVFTPMSEYGIVSPLSPDEVSFEHREVTVSHGRLFENFYSCLEEVGKGKFGSVCRCEEKSTGKIWAAKFLKCRESEKKKLRLEVEIMNKLKHPKILMLWDVFEDSRKMILVMEYIGGGELFERVIDDDFELTERDCIQFMRQICDAVHYMHSRNILHLDLKPENILCIKNESNKIKIIDFGLARYYNKGESVRVMFGTPEFIAPEVVNYDEIGFTTDMWSIGVICYVLLTGLSPFMGDSDAETLSNVTNGEFDFEEEEFDGVSQDGKNFIEKLLVKNKRHRITSQQALDHSWLTKDAARLKNRRINTKNLKRFMARRKWQKTGNAIRALGRMRNSLQKLLKQDSAAGASGDSLSSASGVGSTSSSSSSTNSQTTITDVINASNPLKVLTAEDTATTNQNGGHFASTNHAQELEMSPNNDRLTITNQITEKKSNPSGQTVDINLNWTRENNSAFVRSNSKESGKAINSSNPADLFNDCNSVKCTSLNQNGEKQARTKCLPKFTKEMVDSKAFPGDVVRFDVEFTADKNTQITWYFEDEILLEDEHHCIHDTGDGVCSLIIKDVCEDDDGDYSCKIVNNLGDESCSAELIVYGAL